VVPDVVGGLPVHQELQALGEERVAELADLLLQGQRAVPPVDRGVIDHLLNQIRRRRNLRDDRLLDHREKLQVFVSHSKSRW